MDADETECFAVETTAQIEVLRHAVMWLMVRALLPNSAAGRETILSTFAAEVGDMAPNPSPANPEATRFFEAIAAAMPEHADKFAQHVRAVLAEYPPGTTID